MPGRAFVGTSGFAYKDWAPRFYPAHLRAPDLLRHYADHLTAVELNNTFYRAPTPAAIAGWLASTPDTFRFCVKAQRGGAWRAFRGAPEEAVALLEAAYRPFGERLRCVLLHAPDDQPRTDEGLDRLLAAWPTSLPLALELRHPSWQDDAVHDRLRAHGVALVATDTDALEVAPDLRRTGPFLYLRLRRTTMTDTDIDQWAARLAPFLADGVDACVFLRHDADGASALGAQRLLSALGPIGASSAAS